MLWHSLPLFRNSKKEKCFYCFRPRMNIVGDCWVKDKRRDIIICNKCVCSNWYSEFLVWEYFNNV